MLATVCYIRKDGLTVMIHRDKGVQDMHKHLYVAPGGKFDAEKGDRTLEDTMVRETIEETGLRPLGYDVKGLLTFYNEGRVFPDGNGAKTHGGFWDVLAFTAKDYAGTMLVKGPEGVPHIIPERTLLDLPMHEADYIFTPWIGNGSFFHASFHYEGRKVAGYEKVEFPGRSDFMAFLKRKYGPLSPL